MELMIIMIHDVIHGKVITIVGDLNNFANPLHFPSSIGVVELEEMS